MLQEQALQAAAAERSVWLRPWRVLLMGLAAVFVGMMLMPCDGPVVTPLRLFLMFAGLVAGGWALQQHLTTAGEDFDERIESAGLVAVYSLCGIVGYLGMAPDWFSGHIFFTFFIIATILGSLLLLLPRTPRRLGLTLAALFHFGGILVAVTAIPPPNGQTPWLPMTLWTKVYRPYLTGLYLINAYHFYAPDPGSSTLVWTRVEYEDGSYQWVKFPSRSTAETPLHYQRQMGMCEAINNPGLFPTAEELDDLKRRRVFAGNTFPSDNPRGIPLRSDRLDYTQYMPPNDYSKMMLSSLARHMCRFYPNDKDPSIPATRVKIYRVTYTIITPGELLKGGKPLSDDLKTPFYMGEFDPEGNLVHPKDTEEGKPDPFLYWVVPVEYLKYHAGDTKALKPGEEVLPAGRSNHEDTCHCRGSGRR